MPDNKNQHFVPRCHLKPFTVRGEGRSINLVNLDRMTAIPGAPVKSQCSGDYFYGHDAKLERAIRFVEEGYARGVQDLLDNRPRLLPGHRMVLLRFILLQHLRTEAASRRAFEMTRVMLEMPGVEVEGGVPAFRDAIRAAVREAMRIYAELMGIIDDLKICLVRNDTGIPFVTSDDPAVMTNRWQLQDPRAQGLAFGTKSAGLLFFLPISPDVSCVLYDGDVYTLDHAGGWIATRRASDVAALNEHQILNCYANLYFRDWQTRHIVLDAIAQAAPRRPAARQEVYYAVRDRTEGEWTRYAVIPKPTCVRASTPWSTSFRPGRRPAHGPRS